MQTRSSPLHSHEFYSEEGLEILTRVLGIPRILTQLMMEALCVDNLSLKVDHPEPPSARHARPEQALSFSQVPASHQRPSTGMHRSSQPRLCSYSRVPEPAVSVERVRKFMLTEEFCKARQMCGNGAQY